MNKFQQLVLSLPDKEFATFCGLCAVWEHLECSNEIGADECWFWKHLKNRKIRWFTCRELARKIKEDTNG